MLTETQHDFGPIYVYAFAQTHTCTVLMWKLPVQGYDRPFVQAHGTDLTSGMGSSLETSA